MQRALRSPTTKTLVQAHRLLATTFQPLSSAAIEGQRPGGFARLSTGTSSRIPRTGRPSAHRHLHHWQTAAMTQSAGAEQAASADKPTLELTEQEEVLSQLLHDACAWIERTRPALPAEAGISLDEGSPLIQAGWKCEARIAGGWVRDKLLSKASDDLDISLSTLTGHHFALFLKSYLSSPYFQTSPLAKHRDGALALGTIAKIEANPEQSKNLETATAKVLGLSLDFVNLRKEVYDPASRIPTMTFGTPTEDAERRDITINSMFYNVHTRQVEDFTGRGLADLASGIIRTPLPPLTTFLDDPLRILRCIRFASRFGYKLHPSIRSVLTAGAASSVDGDVQMQELVGTSDPRLAEQGSLEGKLEQGRSDLKIALQTKVSRERFGIEIDKMLKGPDPYGAVQLLQELDLLELVFFPPHEVAVFDLETSEDETADVLGLAANLDPARTSASTPGPSILSIYAARLLNALHWRANGKGRDFADNDAASLASSVDAFFLQPLTDVEQRRRLYYAAVLLPLRHKLYKEKKKFAWAGEAVIMDGLKLGVKQTKEPVTNVYRASDLMLRADPTLLQGDGQPPVPHLWPAGAAPHAKLLLLLQNPSVTNPALQLSVRSAILFTQLIELALAWATREGVTGVEPLDVSAVQASRYWLELIQGHDLEARLLEKPRLDGKQITEVLGFAPGPLMRRIQTAILAWQFEAGPDERSAEECAAWVKEQWAAGGIIPEAERVSAAPAKAKGKGGQQQQKGGQELPKKKIKS